MDNSTTTSTTVEYSPSISRLVLIERYMSIYGPFFLTTFGIIGNILSILIFLSPRYRRQSSHFYLLSLALSDLCFLIINLIEDTFRNHNDLYQSHINIIDRSSSLICIFIQYARNTTRLLSSWIIVSFTIERLLVVFYPLQRAIICRRKIARLVVFLLFFSSLLININVPFHYGIVDVSPDPNIEQTICDILPKYRSIYMRFAISSMISVYLVPMCLIGIVNMLICCKLWSKNLLTEKDHNEKMSSSRTSTDHSTRQFHFSKILSCLKSSSSSSSTIPRIQIEQLEKIPGLSTSHYQSIRPLISVEMNTSKMNDSSLHEDSPSPSHSRSFSNPSLNSPPNTKQSSAYVKSYIQSRTNRVTVTLLLVSCSFLLLNSPYCAVWLANYGQGFRNTTLKSVKEITELFMLTNFCINFLLYCLSGKIFRSELMCLLQCQWKELYNKHEVERMSKKKSRPTNRFPLKESIKGKQQTPMTKLYSSRI